MEATGDTSPGGDVWVTVDATRAVNFIATPLKLLPVISVNGNAKRSLLYVILGQMPRQPRTGDHFTVEARHGHQNQGCTDAESVPVTFDRDERTADLRMQPNADGGNHSNWCADTYTATLYDSQAKPVDSKVFTIEP